MSDDKSSGQSAAVTLEAGIEKLISITNKAIAGGASTHLGLAMLESNLILILRATAKAADISGETIRGLRGENKAMLDLLREIALNGYKLDEGWSIESRVRALLDKHGRSK